MVVEMIVLACEICVSITALHVVDSLSHSLTRSLTHSLTYMYTHTHTHTLTHSPTHTSPFSHFLTHSHVVSPFVLWCCVYVVGIFSFNISIVKPLKAPSNDVEDITSQYTSHVLRSSVNEHSIKTA